MADSERGSVDECSKSDENSTYDPRLDIFSEKFDPLLALRTPDFKIPDINAKKYDNLASYEAATSAEVQEKRKTRKKKQNTEVVNVERRWLPHQMPVKTTRTSRKRNIFTRMEGMGGPLALLRKCKDERLKIKVWTRHEKGIRGYCLGYLVAFDKFWNLALEEVTEFWTRLKKRKIPALDSIKLRKPRRVIRPPKVTVTPHETNKKLENCTRTVGQLMMRGEHIVFINVIQENKEEEEKEDDDDDDDDDDDEVIEVIEIE